MIKSEIFYNNKTWSYDYTSVEKSDIEIDKIYASACI